MINQIFVYHSPTDAAPQFLQKLIPNNRSRFASISSEPGVLVVLSVPRCPFRRKIRDNSEENWLAQLFFFGNSLKYSWTCKKQVQSNFYSRKDAFVYRFLTWQQSSTIIISNGTPTMSNLVFSSLSKSSISEDAVDLVNRQVNTSPFTFNPRKRFWYWHTKLPSSSRVTPACLSSFKGMVTR